MNWFGQYLAARGWGAHDDVPEHSHLPKLRAFPEQGRVVAWASVPNPRGWAMPEEYGLEHYDKPIMAAARERLGSAYDGGFMGELVLIDCEHPSPALRGIDYARVAVLRLTGQEG